MTSDPEAVRRAARLTQPGDETAKCLVHVYIDSCSGLQAALWNRDYFFTVPVLTFEKLWFRFRFQLLKSFGSGSGSYV